MVRIPVFIPEEHHEFLRTLSFEKRISMAKLIRIAIAQYLEKENEK